MSGSSRFSRSILALVALGALALDQASKFAVLKFTAVGSFHVLVPGVLNLVHTSNPGVAFGLLAESETPWRAPLLILFSVAVIALLVWVLATNRAGGWLSEVGLALILGGAAGNVLDRAFRGGVTDFIDFQLGSYHWYTFNIADSAIVAGAAFVVLELLHDWRHPHALPTNQG